MTSQPFSLSDSPIPHTLPQGDTRRPLLALCKPKPIESPHHPTQERQGREDNLVSEQQFAELPQSATTPNPAGPAGEHRRLGQRSYGSLSLLGRRSSPNRVSEPRHRVRIIPTKGGPIGRIVRRIPSVAVAFKRSVPVHCARPAGENRRLGQRSYGSPGPSVDEVARSGS